MDISRKEAKYLAINHQGLLSNTNDTLQIINKIGYVQIDTISVTERSHNHVLHTRNLTYNQEELNILLKQKKIFEYWSHAAAYLPSKDFKFSLFKKNEYKKGDKHWFPRDKKIERYVLDRIKSEGPLQSRDFQNPRDKSHEWYQWKPAKIALTNLFMDGTLMIAERKGFQKVYDLSENVFPEQHNTPIPTKDEYCSHLINNTINYFGLATLDEISYLRRGVKPTLKKIINNLCDEGLIIPLKIENNSKEYYTTKQNIETLSNIKFNNQLHLINPFDNLIIQRQRVKDIFDFDYQIECYVPEKKRIYGYYSLPILFNDNFIGRLDAKADRSSNTFIIKNIWFEKGFIPNNQFYSLFNEKVSLFANFCNSKKIHLFEVSPNSIKSKIKSTLLKH